jgi:hypothetical protein
VIIPNTKFHKILLMTVSVLRLPELSVMMLDVRIFCFANAASIRQLLEVLVMEINV